MMKGNIKNYPSISSHVLSMAYVLATLGKNRSY